MSQFINFLQELATSADLKAQFDTDPTACMREYGLNYDEIALVNEGDIEKLKAHLGEDVYTVSHQVVLHKR